MAALGEAEIAKKAPPKIIMTLAGWSKALDKSISASTGNLCPRKRSNVMKINGINRKKL